MTLWAHGQLVPDDAAVLRADDHGLVVGDGVFETLKVIDGIAFALTRHLSRLARSAQRLGIGYDEDEVRRGVAAVVEAGSRNARLRVTVTGGPSPYGSSRGTNPATVLVASSALDAWPDTADVVTLAWTRNERSALAGVKTTSYGENVIALSEAHDRGAGEAVFGNTRGDLCEGTGSNVFVAVDGVLVTPPLTSGCLAGITRELVLEWVPGIEERDLPLEALRDADEAFLTSSTRDVQPIRAVDGTALAAAPGPLTSRAMAVFAHQSKEILDP